MRGVSETVRLIRDGQEQTYVLAEERADGALLIEPLPSPAAARPEVPAAVASSKAPVNGAADAILEIDELSVSYGAKKAVDGVSLQIRRGEIFGLLGPNGAGKTSTLSAIEGLVQPRAGRVSVDGIDVRRHPLPGKGKARCPAAGNELPVPALDYADRPALCGVVRRAAVRRADRREPAGRSALAARPTSASSSSRAASSSACRCTSRRPRTGASVARRTDGRSGSAITPAAVGPDRAYPRAGREHSPDHPFDGGGPGGVRSGRDHRQRQAPDRRDTARPDREAQGRSRVRGVAHGA